MKSFIKIVIMNVNSAGSLRQAPFDRLRANGVLNIENLNRWPFDRSSSSGLAKLSVNG